MTTLTKEEANAKISEHLAAAYASINEAETLAVEHGLSFSFEVAYGMGGSFSGSEYGQPGEFGDEFDGWYASSQSC
jgi:hypothetical protein